MATRTEQARAIVLGLLTAAGGITIYVKGWYPNIYWFFNSPDEAVPCLTAVAGAGLIGIAGLRITAWVADRERANMTQAIHDPEAHQETFEDIRNSQAQPVSDDEWNEFYDRGLADLQGDVNEVNTASHHDEFDSDIKLRDLPVDPYFRNIAAEEANQSNQSEPALEEPDPDQVYRWWTDTFGYSPIWRKLYEKEGWTVEQIRNQQLNQIHNFLNQPSQSLPEEQTESSANDRSVEESEVVSAQKSEAHFIQQQPSSSNSNQEPWNAAELESHIRRLPNAEHILTFGAQRAYERELQRRQSRQGNLDYIEAEEVRPLDPPSLPKDDFQARLAAISEALQGVTQGSPEFNRLMAEYYSLFNEGDKANNDQDSNSTLRRLFDDLGNL